jgi:GxxExxY protein
MINADNYMYTELTEKIIGCAFKVYNQLGAGFLEKIYENALAIELKDAGLSAQQQYPIKVYYNEIVIGDYIADIVVEDRVIIELKAVNNLAKAHEVQLVNYLKATKIEVGLLINFGDTISVKRKVLSKNHKRK